MKVTLLGDSIRMQYSERVGELLGTGFDVWHPEENGRFAKYTLRGLYDWVENMEGSDIVHWNNGLWDVCRLVDDATLSDKDEYANNMLRIFDILKSRYHTVIFATTTPVRKESTHTSNDDIDCFNGLIVPQLAKRGAIINDLNGLLRPDIYKYIRDDNIHLTEAGIDLCAGQVADCIKKAARNI